MRRVVALVGALIMVGSALLLRSALGDDDGGGDSGSGDGDDRIALLCAEELADVCQTLEDDGLADVQVEAVGTTVDRLSEETAELEADAWLTLDPFAVQVDQRREFATFEPLFDESIPLDGSTGLAIVGFDDRIEALAEDCGEVDWACLGDAAGEPWSEHGGESAWGSVKPGYDAPDTSATGLLVLTQAMADHVGRTDFASQDIDDGWLRDLEDAVPPRTGSSALDTLLTQGRAAFGAVGALGLDAEAAAGGGRGADLVITYPSPMFRATVVLAPRRGFDADELVDTDALAEALEAAGWAAGESGEPLPSAGAIDALRSTWEEVG
jgi:hypothetical protein